MGRVLFDTITKTYGAAPVLRGISLDINNGEFLTLLGPSGCGKSTLLRILAGLETQDGEHVHLDGTIVDGLHPKRRDIAMVFQSYALYPHMTVAANMALPLRMRRLNAWQRLPLIGKLLPGTTQAEAGIDAEVASVATALGIAPLLDRKPGQLSGGQRQRVAVGRAMVRHPDVFLMDEPLSNLDAKLRVQMRTEIKELHQRLGVTFIYVTHDQSEAMTLSDRVAVMLGGELLQVAPPQAIYADPDDRRVAEFIGSPKINMLDGIVRDQGLIAVANTALTIETGLAPGTRVTLGIRPEALHTVPAPHPGAIIGSVRMIEYMGSDLFVHLVIPGGDESGGDGSLIARLPASQAPHIATGQALHVAPSPDAILLFGENGRRIRPPPALERLSSAVTPIREVIG